MRGQTLLAGAALLFLLPSPAGAGEASPAVAALLEPIRAKYDLPALAGAIFTSGGLAEQGVTGVRKRGSGVPATADDLWMLGSDTKAMTAALLATFVAEGRLSWDAPVAALFPEFRPHPALRGITLDAVLSHRAGLAANLSYWIVPLLDVSLNLEPGIGQGLLLPPGDVQAQRLAAVRKALENAPAYRPGTYHYSNTDYVVAGAVAERLGGKPWEDLLAERIFAPLGMASAGCGGVGTPGRIDQPWGHFSNGRPTWTDDAWGDLPDIVGPAGMAHATLADWARFLADQLRGAEGKPALLPPAAYAAMQSPHAPGDYGYGWGVVQRSWAGGKALAHSGSDRMHTSVCWLAPGRDFGVLVCLNQGGDAVAKAADDAASALIRRHLGR